MKKLSGVLGGFLGMRNTRFLATALMSTIRESRADCEAAKCLVHYLIPDRIPMKGLVINFVVFLIEDRYVSGLAYAYMSA